MTEKIERLLELGQMDLEAGYPEYARQYFEKVLALDSANREAIDALARIDELSRREAMAAEPMEAETPTGPPLAKRLMVGANSVFEALEKQSQKRAEEQPRKRARAREPAETYIDGPITSGTRTALIRSLTELLGEPSSDEQGTYWDSSYRERLRALDLEIARLDRKRRALARERGRKERALEEVEGMMRDTVGLPLRQLSGERDELIGELDEVNLSITQLDRDRKSARKERRKIEKVLSSY